jgi:TolB-like protein/class 3 adenylate cyclase/Tfp pilus assembly protein PilF
LETRSVERKLAAIFAADVEGYSRLMGQDEVGTLRTLTAYRVIIDRLIASHRGRIFNTAGDSLVADFASAVDAMQCAVEVQEAIANENVGRPVGEQMRFRIGVHVGDIMVQGDNLFGDAVNIAARLEALAKPGGICVSRVVRDQIRDKLPYRFEDMGEQRVKNITRPVRAYAINAAAVVIPRPVVALAEPIVKEISKPVATIPRLSIVVLPLANLSNDPEEEYFADGITDDLTTDLSRISDSFVIARNTAFTYKGKSVDVKEIGRELGVRYVLEGSVRRTGEQVRVNVQLIETERCAHIWADRFDIDRADLAVAQNEITGRLARMLNLELVADVSRRIELDGEADPDARDFVMRGWSWYYRPYSTASRQEAQRAFERALEIYPASVEARIGVAAVLASNLADGWSSTREQDEERTEQLLLEALERDQNCSMAHYAMGLLRRIQNRLMEAQIEFEAAITLDRNNARAHFQLGNTLLFMGQPEAGIPHIEKAIRLNPYDPNAATLYLALGLCRLFLGQVDGAIDLLGKARAGNPRLPVVHFYLAGAFGLNRDLDEARVALRGALKLKPEVNSLARLRAYRPWVTNPPFWALLDKTINVGLRRIGFPEE